MGQVEEDKKSRRRHGEWLVEEVSRTPKVSTQDALPVCLSVIVAKLKISKSHQKDSQNNPKRYLKHLTFLE
jgi:hypothetical protein